MRITRIFLALIFSVGLFTSCSVDELDDTTPQTHIEDLKANEEGENEGDNGKGAGGG